MRNRLFRLEIAKRFAAHSAPKFQITLAGALVIGSAMNLSAFAAAAEAVKGALLLKQAAPVSALQKLPSEQQIPELAALARANASLPQTVCFPKPVREDGH